MKRPSKMTIAWLGLVSTSLLIEATFRCPLSFECIGIGSSLPADLRFSAVPGLSRNATETILVVFVALAAGSIILSRLYIFVMLWVSVHYGSVTLEFSHSCPRNECFTVLVLVCGSIYLVATVLALWSKSGDKCIITPPPHP